MKEKLLALLVAKFAGVPEAMLEGIATKKAGSVSDETQLQSIADGIDFGQVLQSNVDSKITDANKKAIQNYEATHKLKDGKPVSSEQQQQQKAKDDPSDLKSIVAAAIAEAITPLKDKIEGYEKKETQSGYLSKLKASLKEKGVPEVYWSKRNLTIESDEQLTNTLTEIETDYTGFRQEMVNAGVMIDIPKSTDGASKEGATLGKSLAEKRNTNASDGVKGKEI